MTLDRLLQRVADPTRPFVTYYDLASGERVELSTVTLANWVAKTSNFLVDDADAGPGTRVRIGLPSHWLRVVWILAAWNVGAAVVDSEADVGLSGPELEADEPVRVASALRPFGVRFAEPPEGFIDLGAEVPGHGDVFVALDPPTPDTLALDLAGHRLTHAEVLAAATPESRRVLARPGTIARDATLVVDAALGEGSIVLVTSDDGLTDAAAVARQERAEPL